MLFNSLIFIFAFLPAAYAVFWLLPGAKARYVWLTITGYVFYGYWDARFCLLMAFSTMVSYIAGRVILRTRERNERSRWHVAVPVTIDLLLLGFFKYAGFASRSVNALFDWAGVDASLPVIDVILPVGISFYTFHTITYIVDSYRGVVTPTRNLFEFSAYVSLFSQLIAGPIVRFRQIEQDLENLEHADRHRWLAIGVSFFVFGLVEKVLIADNLALFSDPLFKDPGTATLCSAWIGVLAYTFQLYFDFSGYSSMAVGLGYMFALRIPQNFNSPYKARDPSDFWRRWHISLSSCLRDYLYIPLGGNRYGTLNTYRNLMLTMLIGGMWHGANWTFLLWGAYHGLLLSVYRATETIWDRTPEVIARLTMFALVLLGWVLFRATSISDAFATYSAMFGGHDLGRLSVTPTVASIFLIAGIWAMVGPNAFDFHRNYQWRPGHLIRLAVGFGPCLAIMLGGGNSPFLYFQF